MKRACVVTLVAGGGLTVACAPHADLGAWFAPDAAAVSGSAGERADDAATAASRPGDAGAADAPVGACSEPRPSPASCVFADGTRLPEQLAGDPHGAIRFFATGAALPAGRYRIEYVDGCVRYVSNVFPDASDASGFTVHATAADTLTGAGAFWLVSSDLALVAMAPGTVGALTGAGAEPYGAFATYAECVAANCGLPAREFAFEGGSLGLTKGGIPPSESVIDPSADERTPTFRLSYLGSCSSPTPKM